MPTPTSAHQPASTRSRSGCNECRRRHRKCDEKKPACDYCKSAGVACIYARRLCWGGRPFHKSRFGKYLDAGATAVRVESPSKTPQSTIIVKLTLWRGDGIKSSEFVYALSTAPKPSPSLCKSPKTYRTEETVEPRNEVHSSLIRSISNLLDIADQTDDDYVASSLAILPQSVDQSPTSPIHLPYLIDYFVNGISKSISCHQGIHETLCSVILPMSWDTPHLHAAVLALAAAHRQAARLLTEDGLLAMLRSKCIADLRFALASDSHSNEELLATTLILCMAEIVAPSSTGSSWRTHLNGASALISASGEESSRTGYAMIFLKRKYRALQAMALSCGLKRHEDRSQVLSVVSGEGDIDDLAGYSTELLSVFQAINTLDDPNEGPDHSDSRSCSPDPPHFDCNSHVAHQSHILFDKVHLLLDQRASRPRQIRGLPDQVSHEMFLLDEAYHYMATLQIYRRGSLSVPFSVIEETKQKLFTCLTSMTYDSKPCPSVAALPPLFVAGTLSYTDFDRDTVRALLRRMWISYGMGNARASMLYLEDL